MFARYRTEFDQDPFTDLLFNALLGFTFLLLVAILFLNPPTKAGDIEAKAEYIITTSWEDGSPDDIDTWVEGPGGELVWFRNPEAGLMHLDRDDRGMTNDSITVDGRAVANPLNQEVVTIRGSAPGEYVVNVHYYASKTNRPVPVNVEVVKVNPRLEVLFYGTVTLEGKGIERTAVRFAIGEDGAVRGVTTTAKSLVR